MNITENNKLVAEFMELIPQPCGGYLCLDSQEVISIDNLNYNDEWNMLMQVVEKIESIIIDKDNSFNVTIGSSNYCVIQDSNGEIYEGFEDCRESKILTTYVACIEFIKWYNENGSN